MSFGASRWEDQEKRLGMSLRVKYDAPNTIATIKDSSLPPEKLLEVDSAQTTGGKNAELMKPLKIRFIEDGPERTIDRLTEFKKNIVVEGAGPQQTIAELRARIAEDEGMPLEDVNLFVPLTELPDHAKLGECFVDWTGFGLEEWPPRFVVKPKIKGFELRVFCPAMRDTSVWDAGRLQSYADQTLHYDMEPANTVGELKDMLAKKLRIPAARQRLTAQLRRSKKEFGEFLELDDNKKTMTELEMDKYCVEVQFHKADVDKNGALIFDDGYWDAEGYHPPPLETWIPLDSQADRSRPDSQKNDPTQPATMIVSDRQNF